jgi:hypothetical protein
MDSKEPRDKRKKAQLKSMKLLPYDLVKIHPDSHRGLKPLELTEGQENKKAQLLS